ASVRKCPLSQNYASRGLRTPRRIWTKSSFPESSRRALQVAANRRIQVGPSMARPAARGVERTKEEVKVHGWEGAATTATTPSPGRTDPPTRHAAPRGGRAAPTSPPTTRAARAPRRPGDSSPPSPGGGGRGGARGRGAEAVSPARCRLSSPSAVPGAGGRPRR
ncbi:hypothetical protein THAOC_27649, partial [Thalassiosira oceanica]